MAINRCGAPCQSHSRFTMSITGIHSRYCIERLKMHHNHGRSPSMYFWRTHQKQEIDCIEEEERHFLAIECKWKEKKWQPPKPFRDAYPNHTALLAHPGNIDEVLMPGSS
jgi:hypothetical protein